MSNSHSEQSVLNGYYVFILFLNIKSLCPLSSLCFKTSASSMSFQPLSESFTHRVESELVETDVLTWNPCEGGYIVVCFHSCCGRDADVEEGVSGVDEKSAVHICVRHGEQIGETVLWCEVEGMDIHACLFEYLACYGLF